MSKIEWSSSLKRILRQLVCLVIFASVAPLVACEPYRYEDAARDQEFSRSDAEGVWRGWRGSVPELLPSGEARVRKLDGQNSFHAEGWRVSGGGSWTYYGKGEYRVKRNVGTGPVVEVKIKTERFEWRDCGKMEALQDCNREEPYGVIEWAFGVTGEGEPQLFFLVGDPDHQNLYLMEKE
ncbi:hypothetical protein [Streptomyces alkaliterrae]|uniref:Uncharacterized protein n=1 Tax=Streptomyces alkaliterrae TaxID=2213162 RepID=A0A5P0YSV8_9ACTN|nr:hypothetical protein [Streptomyces alkaliterrae]MBB1254031.1 hypothetical protein [Streptomyces alkaliterrae]MBB1260570.1 hypothetical protein [Streptomyces alkaliterrae]MQS01569.1 hypothetical protein [Streptomyces alkaliterrae]